MLDYSFLTLSLLLALPAVVVAAWRRDLRRPMAWMAFFSVPFAFTERLFYPDYWEPKFLFDLVNIIGFGIEDILFVTGIAAFSTAAYPVVSGARFIGANRPSWRKAIVVLVACFGLVGAAVALGVAMIYAAPAIMLVLGLGLGAVRTDLLVPGVVGTAVTTVVYTAVCLALMALIPGVFDLDWKTDQFLDLYLFGVPVEELLYAATAGWVGTLFFPFVTGAKFGPGPGSSSEP